MGFVHLKGVYYSEKATKGMLRYFVIVETQGPPKLLAIFLLSWSQSVFPNPAKLVKNKTLWFIFVES